MLWTVYTGVTMIVRVPIDKHREWVVKALVGTEIGEDPIEGPLLWARCRVVNKETSDEVLERVLMPPPEAETQEWIQSNGAEEMWERKSKVHRTWEEEKARRSAYNKERYRRMKDGSLWND